MTCCLQVWSLLACIDPLLSRRLSEAATCWNRADTLSICSMQVMVPSLSSCLRCQAEHGQSLHPSVAACHAESRCTAGKVADPLRSPTYLSDSRARCKGAMLLL